MSQVLDELDKGQDVHAVDAALKRHEAISADVHAGVSNMVLNPSLLFQILSRSLIGEKFNSGTENLSLSYMSKGMSIY